MLISVAELIDRLPETEIRIYDCRFSLLDPAAGLRSYQEGHIPGAGYFDLETDMSGAPGPVTGRHPLPAADVFGRLVQERGISGDATVVVYDEGPGAIAARLWWMLGWLGHTNVHVLDGGLAKWLEYGGSLEVNSEAYPCTEFLSLPDDHRWISVEQLVSEMAGDDCLVIDARESGRFIGKVEPIDKVAGHIPGSVNRPFTDNLNSGVFKSQDQLHLDFSQLLNHRPATEIVHSCGSGVTACHNLLAMEIAGLIGSRLFPGSWSEWITDPARPVSRSG
jgi:thiosulfate/3-mercaptopyruvate sulfurtransferase